MCVNIVNIISRTKCGYPLIVFSVTDIQGVFHAICFMLTSHDYYFFFNGSCRKRDLMGLEFEPVLIMQSCYNVVKKLFPNEQVHNTVLEKR